MKKKGKKESVGKRRNTKRGIWKESLSYLKETRNYIFIAVFIFFISALIGFLFSSEFTFFDPILRELAGKIEGLSLLQLMWFIFQNNITSAFIVVIFGVVLGIFPVINALTNGVLLGYVFSKASAIAGFSVIWFLLPHGIFELPAIFIALGLGMNFGMFIFSKNKKKEFVRRFYGSMKVFFSIVLPLLIIAAIIEGILITL
ncbi:MAG: stage II sporulation protein M [Nanoarchaeota archaeon]|nr:stage II sporulation protein M [Nanoarchaeota archaeon]